MQAHVRLLKAIISSLSFLGLCVAVLVIVWRTVLARVEGSTVVSVLRLLQQGNSDSVTT